MQPTDLVVSSYTSVNIASREQRESLIERTSYQQSNRNGPCLSSSIMFRFTAGQTHFTTTLQCVSINHYGSLPAYYTYSYHITQEIIPTWLIKGPTKRFDGSSRVCEPWVGGQHSTAVSDQDSQTTHGYNINTNQDYLILVTTPNKLQWSNRQRPLPDPSAAVCSRTSNVSPFQEILEYKSKHIHQMTPNS